MLLETVPAKVDDHDYINYLIAAQRVFTCSGAAKSQPTTPSADASWHQMRDEYLHPVARLVSSKWVGPVLPARRMRTSYTKIHVLRNGVEGYHRGIKQRCRAERSQVREAIKQLAHITLSLKALLRLEFGRVTSGTIWYESKISVVRRAISACLASPVLGLATVCPYY